MGVANFGCRMTVVKLGTGRDLAVISPIRPLPELVQSVRALGEVKYIIAPSSFHNLFVKPFWEEFPSAQCFGVARTISKVKEPYSDIVDLRTVRRFPWSEDMQTIVVPASSFYEEAIFFHGQSETLILTDFAMNLENRGSTVDRIMFKILGCGGPFGPTRFFKMAGRNRDAISKAVAAIVKFPIKKIIVAHGDIVEDNAKDKLEESYAQYLTHHHD